MNISGKDLRGKVYGRLTALEYAGYSDVAGSPVWKCGCRCGNYTTAASRQLKLFGPAKKNTCGQCRTSEKFPREYNSWTGMNARCSNPKHERYEDYGARGIVVCKAWQDDFFNFLEDMGLQEWPDLTIERRDNDKGYYKENCVWATYKEQANNRRVRKDSISLRR